MARVPNPLGSLTPDAQRIADKIGSKRGGVRGPFMALMHQPELALRVGDLGEYLRFDSSLPGDLRELATLVTVRAVGQPLEWIAHEALAKTEGVGDDVLDLVRTQGDLSTLPRPLATPLRVVEHVLANESIPEDLQEEAVAMIGLEGLVELVTLVGYYLLISGVLFAFGFTVPRGTDSPF